MVDPPRAISTMIAFSKAFIDKMSRGFNSSLTKPTILSPVAFAIRKRLELTANGVAHPVKDIPRASVTHAIVFAVNSPLHDPQLGQATSSRHFSSSSSILPAETFPIASNIESVPTFFPL